MSLSNNWQKRPRTIYQREAGSSLKKTLVTLPGHTLKTNNTGSSFFKQQLQRDGKLQRQVAVPGVFVTESTANFQAGPSQASLQWRCRSNKIACTLLQMTTCQFCTTNLPSANSSLSAPIRRLSLHSSAPTNASANQIDIQSSKRGYLCQRPHPQPVTGYSARLPSSWIVTKGDPPARVVFPPPRCDLAVV